MKKALEYIKSFYLTPRLYTLGIGIAILFTASYFLPALLDYTIGLAGITATFLVLDILILYRNSDALTAQRILPNKLSNGDANAITIDIENKYPMGIQATVIDELPVQFQNRDFNIQTSLESQQRKTLNYEVTPVERGEYHFGSLNVYVTSYIQLVSRRYIFNQGDYVPTYPSFLQLRKYELMAFTNKLRDYGLKKIRKLGHTMEFEQIKEYVMGDDVRNINWKASAKRNELMINQYQDEKSQPVYGVIDKGRVMQMPFNNMSLLDYAINATLVISNIALKKGDKAGMFSFSNQIDNQIMAQKRDSQLNLILENLYNLNTDFKESDFARLYIDVKRKITQRSLLLLFTNFETLDALHRQLPYLQAIAKTHLLVVIFFENTELEKMTQATAHTMVDIFEQTIAQKFIFEKKQIVAELSKYGIQTILTTPENLTINTLNKYLEIKARGML